jgi:hypothetical protein
MRKTKAQISQYRKDVRYLCNHFIDAVRQMNDDNAIKSLLKMRERMSVTMGEIVNDVFKKEKKEIAPWKGNFEDL